MAVFFVSNHFSKVFTETKSKMNNEKSEMVQEQKKDWSQEFMIEWAGDFSILNTPKQTQKGRNLENS